MDKKVKQSPSKKRTRGHTRISSKGQVSIPVDVRRKAGLYPGDELQVSTETDGAIRLTRVDDPLDELTALVPPGSLQGSLDTLRKEWR